MRSEGLSELSSPLQAARVPGLSPDDVRDLATADGCPPCGRPPVDGSAGGVTRTVRLKPSQSGDEFGA